LKSWLLIKPFVNLVLPKLPEPTDPSRGQAVPLDPLVDRISLDAQKRGNLVNREQAVGHGVITL
jgi:hypothetical protein